MGIADLLKFKRPEILRLAQAHGAHNVRIFVAVAKGEARPESDIDFLVEITAVQDRIKPVFSYL